MHVRRLILLLLFVPSAVLFSTNTLADDPAADDSVSNTAVAETTLSVRIAGVSSNDGRLFISVFDSKKGWLKKPSHNTTAAATESSTEDPVIVEIALPPGEYAVHVFHDVDDNGKMKTNFIGIPKEPTGVSNDAKGKFGPPKFVDAKFAVGDEPVVALINMVNI